MRILVTNDDGYKAGGLQALVRALKPFGELTVIAPKYPQSAVAISVSLGYKAMAFRDLGMIDGVHWSYLDATPASCVKFGVDVLMAQCKPDLVVSGINHGTNSATASIYSATLGAAMEAAINGIPGIGISLDNFSPDADFTVAESLFPRFFKKLLPLLPNKFGSYFNVNIPDLPEQSIKGIRVGHMGVGHWIKEFEDWDGQALLAKGVDMAAYNVDPLTRPGEGEHLYLMAGHFVDDPYNTEGADHHLLADGYITVVQHNVDNTDYEQCRRLKNEGIEEDFQA